MGCNLCGLTLARFKDFLTQWLLRGKMGKKQTSKFFSSQNIKSVRQGAGEMTQ